MNLFKPEIYSNSIDVNNGNEIAQNFSKEKNSQFSYDNNYNKECLMFSEFNDELELCMNSSNSDKGSQKQKIFDDKVEKLISSVILKQKNKNINKFNNKKSPNLNQKNNANGFLNNSNYANFNNNFVNFNSNNNNNFNVNSINNNICNAFPLNEIKFNVNNFTNLHSNKIYKEKSDINSFNILNNFESLNSQAPNLNCSASINPSNFYNGPASITTNNINNFHIINSNGPCIFPITHNITNYGNIMNQTIAPQAPIKGDYKIQNQNFNIITEDIINSEHFFVVQKNADNTQKLLKYSDAEIIESTVSKANKNSNNHIENNSKINKNKRKEKFIFNSVSGLKEKGVCGNVNNSNNNNNNNLNIKDKNNLQNLKYKSSGNNNNDYLNKNISAINNNNYNNNPKENCLTKIGNFPDFNLGNFNDGPITDRRNNSNLNNNLLTSYESLKVFEDKSNFIHDKRNQMNYNRPNNVYNNCNNYLINNGALISNPIQFSGFNSLGKIILLNLNNLKIKIFSI
jgi:hypothetical protein